MNKNIYQDKLTGAFLIPSAIYSTALSHALSSIYALSDMIALEYLSNLRVLQKFIDNNDIGTLLSITPLLRI